MKQVDDFSTKLLWWKLVGVGFYGFSPGMENTEWVGWTPNATQINNSEQVFPYILNGGVI